MGPRHMHLACGALLFGSLMLARTQTAHAQPTFYKDVLPVFQEHCQVCHRPGQIGAFSMLDYDEVRPYAKSIKKKVLSRDMPPWFAEPTVGQFSNDPSLSAADIDRIVKWVDGGAIAGNAKDAPKPVEWSEGGWQIAPDIVVKGAEYPVPKDGVVDWMYMAVPTPFTEDTWVTSMEMRPGADPSATHHYCVYIVPKLKDVKYGVPTAIEQLGVTNGGFDGCYEPGQGPFDYRPYQAGRLVPANSDMIFQMHYAPKGKQAVVDQPQVGFTTTPNRPPRQFVFLNVGAGLKIDIPPNDPNYKAPTQEGELTVDTQIVWLQGHAHYRAKRMEFTVVHPDGTEEPALHLRWHPFWQQIYYPKTPIVAPKGTVVRVEGWYDNSLANRYNPDANARVPFGLQGTEEMLFPTFGFVVDGSIDVSKQMSVIKPSARADMTFSVVNQPSGTPVAAR